MSCRSSRLSFRFLVIVAATSFALSLGRVALAQSIETPVTDAELDRPLVEPPREPGETSKNRAIELYNQGLDLANRGKTREALRAFRKAYEQHGTPDSIANIAALEMALGKPRAAAEHLSFAMDRMLPFHDTYDDLQARLAAAKKLVGTVRLSIPLSGADVQWDAAWLGSGPMARPLYVHPGTEHLLLVRYGGVEHRRKIKLAKGEALAIALTADDFPGAAPPSSAAVDEAPKSKDKPASSAAVANERLPWILGGAGLSVVLAGVAAGGFGAMIVADGERAKIEGDIVKFGGTCQPKPIPGFIDDCRARDEEASNQMIGLGVGVAGATLAAAAAAVTLGLALKAPSRNVSIAPGLGGVWIAGKF